MPTAEDHPYRPFPTVVIPDAPVFPRIVCGAGTRRVVLAAHDRALIEELHEEIDGMGTKTSKWRTIQQIWSKEVEVKVAKEHMYSGMDYKGNTISTEIAMWLVDQIVHLTGR